MTEDVADKLLSAIEDCHAVAYHKLYEQLRPVVVNQWIGKYLKDLLGAEIIRVLPSTKKNGLSEILSREGLQAAGLPEDRKRHDRLFQAGRTRLPVPDTRRHDHPLSSDGR